MLHQDSGSWLGRLENNALAVMLSVINDVFSWLIVPNHNLLSHKPQQQSLHIRL